jgi:chemotaxis protein MotB
MAGGHGGDHENHERWLVTYADMLTLLMVLFIVLFAMSQVDQAKFNQLKNSLAVGFGGESAVMEHHGSQAAQGSNSNPMDSLTESVGEKKPTVEDEKLKEAVANADRAKQSQMAQHAAEEVGNLKEVQKRITEELTKQGLQDTVRFSIDERGLVVTVITSSVVFGGDRADLLEAGRQIIDTIGPTLMALPNRIEVDGHTNQLPVATVNYPSGWELSAARASSVVRYLHDRHGLPENRLTAVGFADTKPLYPANDTRSTTMNRRVEVVVLSTLPAPERALLPSAAGHYQ